jgi:putative ABC transport system substrate-binding protein
MSPDLAEKQLEILKEAVPKISRVAVLHNPANPGNAPQVRHAQDAAQVLHFRVQILGAKGPGDIDSAFAAMSREHAGGAIVLLDAVLQNNRARIAELSARHRLPAVYGLSEYTDVGGLMAYGPDRVDMFRHAAIYIDQILKVPSPAICPWNSPISSRSSST